MRVMDSCPHRLSCETRECRVGEVLRFILRTPPHGRRTLTVGGSRDPQLRSSRVVAAQKPLRRQRRKLRLQA